MINRLLVHITVNDLKNSTLFYQDLFGSGPDSCKPEYVKWNLTNPPVNFSISNYAKVDMKQPDIEDKKCDTQGESYYCIPSIKAMRNSQGEDIFSTIHSVETRLETLHEISQEWFHSLNDNNAVPNTK